MFVCAKCRELIENYTGLDHYYEPDTGYGEDRCPVCKSTLIFEGKRCKSCEEYEVEHHLTADGYCRACVNRARDKFNEFFNGLEDDEQEILKNEFYINLI